MKPLFISQKKIFPQKCHQRFDLKKDKIQFFSDKIQGQIKKDISNQFYFSFDDESPAFMHYIFHLWYKFYEQCLKIKLQRRPNFFQYRINFFIQKFDFDTEFRNCVQELEKQKNISSKTFYKLLFTRMYNRGYRGQDKLLQRQYKKTNIIISTQNKYIQIRSRFLSALEEIKKITIKDNFQVYPSLNIIIKNLIDLFNKNKGSQFIKNRNMDQEKLKEKEQSLKKLIAFYSLNKKILNNLLRESAQNSNIQLVLRKMLLNWNEDFISQNQQFVFKSSINTKSINENEITNFKERVKPFNIPFKIQSKTTIFNFQQEHLNTKNFQDQKKSNRSQLSFSIRNQNQCCLNKEFLSLMDMDFQEEKKQESNQFNEIIEEQLKIHKKIFTDCQKQQIKKQGDEVMNKISFFAKNDDQFNFTNMRQKAVQNKLNFSMFFCNFQQPSSYFLNQ